MCLAPCMPKPAVTADAASGRCCLHSDGRVHWHGKLVEMQTRGQTRVHSAASFMALVTSWRTATSPCLSQLGCLKTWLIPRSIGIGNRARQVQEASAEAIPMCSQSCDHGGGKEAGSSSDAIWVWVTIKSPGCGLQVLVHVFPFARATHCGVGLFLTHTHISDRYHCLGLKVADAWLQRLQILPGITTVSAETGRRSGARGCCERMLKYPPSEHGSAQTPVERRLSEWKGPFGTSMLDGGRVHILPGPQ